MKNAQIEPPKKCTECNFHRLQPTFDNFLEDGQNKIHVLTTETVIFWLPTLISHDLPSYTMLTNKSSNNCCTSKFLPIPYSSSMSYFFCSCMHGRITLELCHNSGHIRNPFSPLFYPQRSEFLAPFHTMWPRIDNQNILKPRCMVVRENTVKNHLKN